MTEDTSLREKALRDKIPEDVMRLAREALAQEYVNEYPSYADLALRGTGSFTLCSIHAVARAIMSAREANRQRIEALEAALKRLLDRDERNTCQHEDTHRGGFLWTICDACGSKWADDEGGKSDWQDPSEWVQARAALSGKEGQS